MNRRLNLRIVAPAASPEEAAAVVAGITRFMRDTAPAPAPASPGASEWKRAALLEAAGYGPGERSPWST